MRHLFVAIAMAVAAVAFPATAQTAEEQRQIDWALERGRLIFALDRVAWVATDDMRERIPDLNAAGLRGYVVDRDERGFVPIFYGEENGRLVMIYRARVAGAGGITDATVFPVGQRPALSPLQTRMARALETLRRGPVNGCGSAPANVSIIPPDGPEAPLDLYLTAPQMRPGFVQFGGHERITFGPDGVELARRPFTRTCLEMPAPPENLRRQGAMLGFNHLLDATPNEIHVFLAMAAEQPIVIVTRNPDRTWKVTGDRIELLRLGAPSQAN